jgi:predicted transcriptional regulator
MKNKRELEKIVRGFSNHRRIEIIKLLDKSPELSIIEISEKLNVNFKTISEHSRRLFLADLITKKNMNHSVLHKLTLRGKQVLKFLRTLE